MSLPVFKETELFFFLYITSQSFFSFLYIFLFVYKTITNLVTKIFFRILGPARFYKRKNAFGHTTAIITIKVGGIIYRKTIYTTANMYTGRCRIGRTFYHRISLHFLSGSYVMKISLPWI